jgi:hypothetical protein
MNVTLEQVSGQRSTIENLFRNESGDGSPVFTTLVCPSHKIESNQNKFARFEMWKLKNEYKYIYESNLPFQLIAILIPYYDGHT